jgi:hypothetical protein
MPLQGPKTLLDFAGLVEDLKRTRDEIKLQIHRGSREVQDERSEVEQRWTGFESRAQLDESARDVGDAIKIPASELKGAFAKVRKAL